MEASTADDRVQILDKTSRANRGKRMNKLIGEELDADEAFWGQSIFAETLSDDEFDSDQDEEDVVDADFDAPEEDTSAQPPLPIERDVMEPKKRKSVYIDVGKKKPKAKPKAKPAPKPKKSAPAVVPQSPFETPLSPETPMSPSSDRRSLSKRGRDEAPSSVGSRGVTTRPSTRMRTELNDDWQDDDEDEPLYKKAKKAKAAKAKVKAVKAKKGKGKRGENTISLARMLAEAEHTELLNRESLAQMRALEESKKRAAPPPKQIVGPRIFTRSVILDGAPQTTITFTDVNDFPPVISAKAPPYAERIVCPVTGKLARYKDPRTGVGYYDLAAYNTIQVGVPVAADPPAV
eukprot:TRINITY_DN7485_c0_g1_i1.p1 TRINITY_DN7485_c0_g1~~TRINITY_DN7485_c0_g1_i1.p1  ORF type:complete len:348 (-),score=78.70 TRINITY_DN7485_c0_g1_i1:151-1194(-)